MHDEVKFIFKTLLKVPIMIMVSYAVLNVFAFFFIYFKMLGVSYVVMETAVENNYLPASELTTLYNYMGTIDQIPMVEPGSARIILGVNGSIDDDDYDNVFTDSNYILLNATGGSPEITPVAGEADARTKRQYGTEVTVGVQCRFQLIWPLSYSETISGTTFDYEDTGAGVEGMSQANGTNSGYSFSGFKSESELEQTREDKETHANIRMIYTVPGLRYYPDMLL